jgi:hypothetical protein
VGENVETVFYILIFSVTCLTFFILYLNSYWKKTRVVVKVPRKKRHLSEQRALDFSKVREGKDTCINKSPCVAS